MTEPNEREARRDMGMLACSWWRDLARAEALLKTAGATTEEIYEILGSQFVPSNTDETWAMNSRSWYAATVEGL